MHPAGLEPAAFLIRSHLWVLLRTVQQVRLRLQYVGLRDGSTPFTLLITARPATPESSFRVPIHLIQFSNSAPYPHDQSTLLLEAALPRKALLLAHSWHPLLTDLREIRILHCAAYANSLELLTHHPE